MAVLLTAILLVPLAGCRRKPVVNPGVPTARRNVNVVLVVDRSGSLATSGSCVHLIEAARGFVTRFASGPDKVGLVTFATSTFVNFPISGEFQTANPDIATVLSGLRCAGSTSSAQALWTGYQQLLELNEPDAVNAIVFFTDGEPTGVTFDMPIANSSGCSEYTPGSPEGAGGYAMPSAGKGYIRGVYSSFSNVLQWHGLHSHMGVAGPDGLQEIKNGDLQAAANSTGCAYRGNTTNTSDFLGVPTTDIHGNSANTSYQPVTLNSLGFIDIANNRNAMATAYNAADSAATNIRNGVGDPVSGRGLRNVIIYSIGLGTASVPASDTFLRRVSNDILSPIYDPSKPTGKYIQASSMAALKGAFNAVASEIIPTGR